MTDYAELRAALDAGPTPGPWTMDGTGTRALVRGADLTIVAVRHRLSGQAHEANARLIAAANPKVIRALLAERDALIHDNAEYVGAASALATENQRLREALEVIMKWPVTSPLNMDAHNMAAVAQAALAQGQEES